VVIHRDFGGDRMPKKRKREKGLGEDKVALKGETGGVCPGSSLGGPDEARGRKSRKEKRINKESTGKERCAGGLQGGGDQGKMP